MDRLANPRQRRCVLREALDLIAITGSQPLRHFPIPTAHMHHDPAFDPGLGDQVGGIISQQLVPKVDGSGRAMALEILVNTPAVAANIRDGKTFMLGGVMQTGKAVGMITMDDSLRALYSSGQITRDECEFRSEDKSAMKAFFAKH